MGLVEFMDIAKEGGSTNQLDIDRPLDNDRDVLQQVFFGGPKLRSLFVDVYDAIKAAPDNHAQVLILVMWPRIVEIVHKIAGFRG